MLSYAIVLFVKMIPKLVSNVVQYNNPQHSTGKIKQNSPLEIIKRARAAPQVALGEVIQMDPGISSVLLALDHGRGGVVGAGILGLGIGVHHARPNESSSLLGLHLHVEVGEHSLATLLDVGEVQEESQDTRTAGEQLLAPVWQVVRAQTMKLFKPCSLAMGIKNLQSHIVVVVIELPHIVLEDLKGLVVRLGNVGDLLDLSDGGLHVLVGQTVRSAPRIRASASL